MANYNSTTEGTWFELFQIKLTDDQKNLLRSTDESEQEAKQQLINKIKSDQKKSVSSEKSSELTNLYNSVKPELNEGDVYELISIDVSETDNGILNCRINGEHKQIRF